MHSYIIVLSRVRCAIGLLYACSVRWYFPSQHRYRWRLLLSYLHKAVTLFINPGCTKDSINTGSTFLNNRRNNTRQNAAMLSRIYTRATILRPGYMERTHAGNYGVIKNVRIFNNPHLIPLNHRRGTLLPRNLPYFPKKPATKQYTNLYQKSVAVLTQEGAISSGHFLYRTKIIK